MRPEPKVEECPGDVFLLAGIKRLIVIVPECQFYFPPFRLLSSLHNIWQFASVVFPPSFQGVM